MQTLISAGIMNDTNKGVRCNVCDCVYNEKGCDCNKEQIEVSTGSKSFLPDGETPHFCKSYVCKNADCSDNTIDNDR